MMKKAQSYDDLEIYELAKELAVKVHKMTLEELPKRSYQQAGTPFLSFPDLIGESRVSRENGNPVPYIVPRFCGDSVWILWSSQRMTDRRLNAFSEQFAEYEELGAKLFNFRESVIKGHLTCIVHHES